MYLIGLYCQDSPGHMRQAQTYADTCLTYDICRHAGHSKTSCPAGMKAQDHLAIKNSLDMQGHMLDKRCLQNSERRRLIVDCLPGVRKVE